MAGYARHGLLARVDEVGVDLRVGREWTHAEQTVLRLQPHLHARRHVVGDERRHTDAEVHVVTVTEFKRGALRDLIAVERHRAEMIGEGKNVHTQSVIDRAGGSFDGEERRARIRKKLFDGRSCTGDDGANDRGGAVSATDQDDLRGMPVDSAPVSEVVVFAHDRERTGLRSFQICVSVARSSPSVRTWTVPTKSRARKRSRSRGRF